MTVFVKALVCTAICMAASQETCNTKINGGGCNFINCFSYRGPTDCVGSFPGKMCMCKPGYCTNEDKSVCMQPGPAASADFSVGDAVDVQDEISDVPTPGTVTNVNPLKVEPEGCPWKGAGFEWAIVHHQRPMHKVGQAVETRDSDTDSWKPGTVTKVSKSGVIVQPDGWKTAFTFAQVRRQDWRQVAAEYAAAQKKRLLQFAAGAQKCASDLAAAHKASVDAVSAAKLAADAAAAQKKAFEAAAAELSDAEAVEKKQKAEEASAAKSARMASAKAQSAQQATEAAHQALEAATEKASREVLASEAAVDAAARKNSELETQKTQEAQETGVAQTSFQQVSDEQAKGNQAMAAAMTAAHVQAVAALKATHDLVLELQKQKAAADQRSAQASTASSDAQKDAETKKGDLDSAMHDGTQQTVDSAKAGQLAIAAKSAADSASDALQQAKQAAAAAKQASDDAAAKGKATETVVRKLLAEEHDANTEVEIAEAKSKCVSNMKSQIVLFQKQEPKKDDGTPMFLIVSFAAIAMVMAFVWHSPRRGGQVVMPESLLG